MSIHIKWPSFDNIHQSLISRNPLILSPEPFVLVTEKLNGSNVCVECNKDGILSIGSRNCLIWTKDNESRNVSLNCKDLSFLFNYESNFKALYTIICTDYTNSLIIYGEFMSNFHPFGIYSNKTGYRLLNLDLWNLFKDNGFDPPKIFFNGYILLSEAIEKLHPIMINASSNFEGVFLNIIENSECKLGYKYKTPLYEEQPKFPYELALSKLQDVSFKPMVDRINEIFEMKPLSKEKTKETSTCVLSEDRSHEINLAIDSYISKNEVKSVPFETVMKDITKCLYDDLQVSKKDFNLRKMISLIAFDRIKSL